MLQKRSAQFFNKRLVLKWSKIIDCESSVVIRDYDLSVAVLLTDPWSSMKSWILCPQMRNPAKISKEHRLRPCSRLTCISVGTAEDRLDIACLCGAKQTAKHKAYKLYTWFKFSAMVHWRNIANYIWLENTTLERFSWRVQSDSDGVAWSSPLSRKKKVCKHQPYAKRCILNAQQHKTHQIIIACTQ